MLTPGRVINSRADLKLTLCLCHLAPPPSPALCEGDGENRIEVRPDKSKKPGAAIFEKNNSRRQIHLGIDYKIVFSVFVICKLYVNMYMALGKIQVSLLLFLPLSYSGSFQGYLGSYLITWPGDPKVLSQPHLPESASLPDLTSP